MYRMTILALTLALAGAAGGVEAGDKAEPKKVPPAVAELLKLSPDEFIQRFDKNKDGLLAKDELPAFLGKAFDASDANGDGKLDRAEVAQLLKLVRNFVAAQQAKGPAPADVERVVNKLLLQFDTDKDGKISKSESKGNLLQGFDKFDTNKDGFLDRAELSRVAAFILQKGLAKGAAGGRPLDFDALDRNADGRLSRDEVKGTPLEKLFDQIDTNRDGRISREEFEAHLEKTAPKQP